jgi:hypothetical protein
MSHRHVAELTPHPYPSPSTGHSITSWTKDTSCIQGVKGLHWPAYSFDTYATRKMRWNTTFLQRLLKMTAIAPLPRRKQSESTRGRFQKGPWELAVARSSNSLAITSNVAGLLSFAPLISAIFAFLCKKSRISSSQFRRQQHNFDFCKKVVSKSKP